MNVLAYPTSHEPPKKRILVIGDWLVDEHWVVGVQRSKTSSRVGRAHFRALQDPDSTVTSFCGAGRTAGILHRAQFCGDSNVFGIIGLGVWHEDDQSSLEAMLDSASVKGCTPHQIRFSYEREPNPKKRRLINLVPEAGCLFVNGFRPGTTRVIRVYRQTGQEIDLQERIDWEVKIPERGWVSKAVLESHPELEKVLAEQQCRQ
jgi:hypothetical protein